jgi:hypothetical protein
MRHPTCADEIANTPGRIVRVIFPIHIELSIGMPWQWKPLRLPAHPPRTLIIRWLGLGLRISH